MICSINTVPAMKLKVNAMDNCPTCYRAISNFHCPHCEEVQRGKTRHQDNDYVYRPTQQNNNSFDQYPIRSGDSTSPGVVFNVIAAIVIIGITLFVAYQVIISK